MVRRARVPDSGSRNPLGKLHGIDYAILLYRSSPLYGRRIGEALKPGPRAHENVNVVIPSARSVTDSRAEPGRG
eukprot:6115801-Pyramimonas_sp.AAC.1